MPKLDSSNSRLAPHAARLEEASILGLFAAEPDRLTRMIKSACGLTLDLSKEKLDAAALAALLAWAREAGLENARDRLLGGEIANPTEKRAALHAALRGAPQTPQDKRDEAEAVRARARAFAKAFASGEVSGASGRRFDQVLHIGIGGSDLGPRLALDALADARRPGLRVEFVENVDGADIADALAALDPQRTLVVIVSKTFTTLETIANAKEARAWLQAALGQEGAAAHMAAVTAAPAKAREWGIADNFIFPFWDWVGGRYSVWSAVGLSVELALQEGAFDRFLQGAAAMDTHFATAPLEENLPVLGALAQTWRREGLHMQSYALVPYAKRLRLLPAWAQQLEMESNGKRVDVSGRDLALPAAAITWGGSGTSVQHSFFQMLHQGVDAIPVDFLALKRASAGPAGFHQLLLANVIAQAEALLVGKTAADAKAELLQKGVPEAEAQRLAPHLVCPGNRPSTMLALDALTPETFGALLAFYEHRVYAQSVLAGVNAFDQYGVELGKQLASKVAAQLAGGEIAAHDPSTDYWIKTLRHG